MKKFLIGLFVFMGFLFLCQMIILTYLFVFDPYNLKPILFPKNDLLTEDVSEQSMVERAESRTENQEVEIRSSQSVNINQAQVEALESVGLNEEAVMSFTSAQITCFEGILGSARVAAIRAGAVPTASEFLAVRGCL